MENPWNVKKSGAPRSICMSNGVSRVAPVGGATGSGSAGCEALMVDVSSSGRDTHQTSMGYRLAPSSEGLGRLCARRWRVCAYAHRVPRWGRIPPSSTSRRRPAPVRWRARTTGCSSRDIRFVGLERVSESYALNQLRSEVGRPFDSETVQNDLQRLERLGQFREISAEVVPGEDGTVSIEFTVEESPDRDGRRVDRQSSGQRRARSRA